VDCIKKSSSTNNGIEIPKLNAVASDKSFLAYRELVEIGFEKLALWPANSNKWNLSAAVQACWKKIQAKSRRGKPKDIKLRL